MARKIVEWKMASETIDGVLATMIVAELDDGSLVYTGIDIGPDAASGNPEWHSVPPVPNADEMD